MKASMPKLAYSQTMNQWWPSAATRPQDVGSFEALEAGQRLAIRAMLRARSPALPSAVHGGVLFLVVQLPLGFPMRGSAVAGARLVSIFPPGGVGTTFEVTVSGVDLDNASRIYFSHVGITSKPQFTEGADQAGANKFVITIASNVPPNIYLARVIGRFGISNARSFVISDRPEIAEAPNNQSLGSAGEVTLDTIVNGHADANAADYFKFAAKKGRRTLIDCLAKVIDSRMDPVLVLFDADGREVDRNRRGGLLDFTPEADGPMTVKVHDFLFAAEEIISIGLRPALDRIWICFPPRPARTKEAHSTAESPGGTSSEMKVGGKFEQLAVEIDCRRIPDLPARSQSFLFKPADSPVGDQYRLRTQGLTSNRF